MASKLFYGVLCLLLFAGCGKDSELGKDDPQDDPSEKKITLELLAADLVFEDSGGVKTFSIVCNGEWKIEKNGNWCIAGAEAGNGNCAVNVTVGAYEGVDDRSTTLTVKAGELSRTVNVTQKRKDAIVLAKNRWEISSDGGTVSVEVKSNIDYEVTIPEKFRSWISLSPDSKALESKTYRFTIGENGNPEERTGYIVFSGGTLKDTVYVVQAQKNAIILGKDRFEVSPDGGTVSVEVKSNIDYEVTIPGEFRSWISLSPDSKALESKICRFAIGEYGNKEEKRMGYIVFSGSSIRDTVYIIQEKLDTSLEFTCLSPNGDLPASECTITLQLRCNIAYEMRTEQSWISLVSVSEKEEIWEELKKIKTYVFKVDENRGSRRVLIFSIYYRGEKITTFRFEQEAGDFTETVSGVSFDMVYVKGGTFQMGATEEQGSDYLSDEKPVHSVTLSDYYIGKFEVTQGLWKAVMGSNPSSNANGDNYPVERVSWNDVQKFLTKLNQLTGKKYVLPTEAQWEYAARGGAKSKGYKYSGSNTVGNVAWYYVNVSDYKSRPVGTKSPNELGIYDMTGNVCEWCGDWYDSNYYDNSPQINPTGPASGSYRVFRGGGWGDIDTRCRVSCRGDFIGGFGGPDYRRFSLGFRVALVP